MADVDALPSPEDYASPAPSFSEGTGFSFAFVEPGREGAPGSVEETASAAESVPVRLVLKDLISVGGQGEVWEAWQPSLRRTVAVKIHASGNLKRFAREARLTGELEHPAIVPVLEFGVLHRQPSGEPAVAMVMKRLRGERWDELIRRDHESGLLPSATGLARHLAILDTVCQAVTFAHSKGVLHLDLKPSQVIVGEFGETSLYDWGMAARRLESGTLDFVSPPAGPFGTPGFMPPEQALGDLESVGVTTDTYLLAATAHFIIAGRPPHQKQRIGHWGARYGSAAALPASTPSSLRQVVERGLSADPRGRFQTVEELRLALAAALRRLAQEEEAARLAAEARRTFSNLGDRAEYEELELLGRKLERARALAPEDPQVGTLWDWVMERYTMEALQRGDLALASLMAGRIGDAKRQTNVRRRVRVTEDAVARRERQRVLARRSAFATLAALLAVLLVSSVVLSVAFRREARASARAEEALAESRRELARASTQAALAYLEKRRPADAREALRRVPEEQRGWEWGYLASRATPETTLLHPREETFRALALSLDGTVVGAIRSDGKALLLTPVTGPRITQEFATEGEWTAIAGGEGATVIAGTSAGKVAVLRRGAEPSWRTTPHGAIQRLATAANAAVYAVAGEELLALHTNGTADSLLAGDAVTVLTVSAQGVAAGTRSGSVFQGRHGEALVETTARHESPVLGLAWDREGGRLVSWAGALGDPTQADSRAIVHRLGEATPLHVTYETDSAVTAAAWAPDGGAIMLLFSNAWMHELSTAAWSVARSAYHGVGVATAVHYSESGDSIALISRGLLQTRETEWLGQELVLRTDSRRLASFVFHRDLLVAAGTDGGVGIFRLDQTPDRLSAEIGPDAIASLESARTTGTVLAAHRWGWVYAWSVDSELAKGPGAWADVNGTQLRSNPDGSLAAVMDAAGRAAWVDMATSATLIQSNVPGGALSLAVHPTRGYAVVAGRAGGMLHLAPNDVFLMQGIFAGGLWTALQFDRSGNLLFAAHQDGSLHVLDIQNRATTVLPAHRRTIRRLTLSGDGAWLLSASEDETAGLWNVAERRLERLYEGSHAGAVMAAVLTPDGRRVITASEDALLRVFDRATGVELAAFEHHQFGIVDMVLAADGRRIVTAGMDGRITVWNPLRWDQGDGVLTADPLPQRPLQPFTP